MFEVVTVRRGEIQTGISVDADDRRFAGDSTITLNDERYDGARVGTLWGSHRIENADGVWTGSFVGSGDPATLRARAMARYVGEGAYEGLVAIVFHDLGGLTFEGVIVPGSLAPPAMADTPEP